MHRFNFSLLLLTGGLTFMPSLHGQNVLFKLDSLPACTLEEVLDAKQISAFRTASASDENVEALAESLLSQKKQVGHFLLGWAAEHPPAGQRPDLLKALQHYRSGASASHPASQVNLAALLMRGTASHPEAGDLLRSALPHQPAQAGFFLGIHSLSNASNLPEAEEALQFWEQAGKAGSARAWRHIGMAREGLLGFPGLKKTPQAADAYHAAVKLDDHEARVRLGALLLNEKQIRGNAASASPKQLFNAVRESDQAEAIFLLGQVMEQNFPEHPASPTEAREIYLKAAEELKHPPAMVRLGLMAAEKVGQPFPPEALSWYEKAAALGHGPAQHQLALHAASQPEGAARAFRGFLSAAQSGYAPAAGRVADAYRRGDGTPADSHAAASWYSRAVETGDTDAMLSLAEMMLSSDGVPFNEQLLEQLTQRSLSSGNPRAGLLIGMMYLRGIGKEKSGTLALAHLRWSGKRGLTQATALAESVSAKLSELEITEANRIEASLPQTQSL